MDVMKLKTNVWRWMSLNTDFDAVSNRYGHQIVADGLPKYTGMADAGIVYTLTTTSSGVTLAAANASTTAATFQPVVGFINPLGSGVTAILIEATYGIQSTGASAANEGIPFYEITTVSTPASTSIGSAVVLNHKTLAQAAAGGQKVIASINSAFTGNGSTWIYVKPFAGAAGARTAAPTASINVSGMSKEPLDGLIQIPPGVGVGLGVLAAGTNITVAATLTWAEVPSM